MQQSMQRRDFVRTAASAVGAAVPATRGRHAYVWGRGSSRSTTQMASVPRAPTGPATLRDPRVRALALSAVDAARNAGAQYATVRLTKTIDRIVSSELVPPPQTETLGLSVRALVNGYWGWAATPTLSADEAVRVARLAAQFATRAAAHGKPRAVELAPAPAIQGEWSTPVTSDPFELDVLDLHLWLAGMHRHLTDVAEARGAPRSAAWIAGRRATEGSMTVDVHKQERLFATTDGTFLLQTVITIAPRCTIQYRGVTLELPKFKHPVQAGWEYVSETPLVELFTQEMDKVDATPPPLPIRKQPLPIGRYDMIFTAQAMAQVLNLTLGPATELDRVLGDEADASGVSYLDPDPLATLGKAVASPLVTITAERSAPTGLATVKWDEEGVPPEDITLVKQGILMDYQTAREHAGALVPWYTKHGSPVRSHGYAMAPTAMEEPLPHLPNLVVHPGQHPHDVETLIRELDAGVLVEDLLITNTTVDWRCRDVFCRGVVATEIRRGKRVAQVSPCLVFNAPEFWHNIEAVGGPASAIYGLEGTSLKGEPQQRTTFSIGAVPARVGQLAILIPEATG